MWPRYGSFPGWNPIVELSLTFHNLATGANGQRQAMYLENVSGFAVRILRNFDVTDEDSALVISSSGTNVVPVEIAEELKKKLKLKAKSKNQTIKANYSMFPFFSAKSDRISRVEWSSL